MNCFNSRSCGSDRQRSYYPWQSIKCPYRRDRLRTDVCDCAVACLRIQPPPIAAEVAAGQAEGVAGHGVINHRGAAADDEVIPAACPVHLPVRQVEVRTFGAHL